MLRSCSMNQVLNADVPLFDHATICDAGFCECSSFNFGMNEGGLHSGGGGGGLYSNAKNLVLR